MIARIYLGTYTGPKTASRGIYTLSMDLASGRLTAPELAVEAVSPSFLVMHPSRRFLLAVAEIAGPGRKGLVCSYAVDEATGSLRLLNQQPSGGSSPCHLTVDRAGRHVLVANYRTGSVSVLPIGADGRLGEATDFVQHEGTGANPKRQEGPHAHSVNFDPAERFALVADLGIDKIVPYRFDAERGKLLRGEAPPAALAPGAGPRHLSFEPAGRFAYVINELNNTVTAFAYDAHRGELREVQTVPALPGGYAETSYTSEVRVHPGGRFLYGSNRGHDSLAIFAIDPAAGTLTPVGHTPTLGKWPRHFAFDPTGAWLVCANHNSDNLVVFRVDARSGALTPTGEIVSVPYPVCVRFAET